MSIKVTPEEYKREREHIDWLYYRIRLDIRNQTRWYKETKALDHWIRTVRRQSIEEKWTSEEWREWTRKYYIPRKRHVQERLRYWAEQHEKHYQQLKTEREKFRKKIIIVIPEFMYRLSMAISGIPLHRKYYNTLIQAWFPTRAEAERYEDEAEKKLIEWTERKLGYPWYRAVYKEEDWWFSYKIDTGIQRVAYDSRLIGKWELRFEDDKGKTIQKEEGKAGD